jgi:hypothetical protein
VISPSIPSAVRVTRGGVEIPLAKRTYELLITLVRGVPALVPHQSCMGTPADDLRAVEGPLSEAIARRPGFAASRSAIGPRRRALTLE